MSKPSLLWWRIQALVDTEVARIAPDSAATALVDYNYDEAKLDPNCEGVGRAPWHCVYTFSPNNGTAPALLPRLIEAIAHLQERYDLAVTFG